MSIQRYKRTKQLQVMVDVVNHFLKNNRIKEQSNDVFNVCEWTLLQTRTYLGFNYFKDKELEDGTVISVLAGTSDPEKFDYLQLY